MAASTYTVDVHVHRWLVPTVRLLIARCLLLRGLSRGAWRPVPPPALVGWLIERAVVVVRPPSKYTQQGVSR